MKDAGIDALGMHLEAVTPEVRERIMPGKAQVPLERYFEAFAAAVAGVRARPGLDLHPRRPRRHARGDPRDLREADRARRLSLRGAVRADLRHAARKPSAAAARVHARRSCGRSRAMLRAARPARDRHQGRLRQVRRLLGACRPTSAAPAKRRERAHDLRSVSRVPAGRVPREVRDRRLGAPRGRGAAARRCSARSRASSQATTATTSTPSRSRWSRSPRSASRRTRWSAPCASTRPSRACGGARASRSPPTIAASARSAPR